MSVANLAGALILWAAATIVALSIYLSLHSLVHELVDQTTGLGVASAFFTRTLFWRPMFSVISC
jgi:hypothetical protein